MLSGHLHKPKSWRGQCGPSWSLNPTCDDQAHIPNHIIVDTDKGSLIWVTERSGTCPVQVLKELRALRRQPSVKVRFRF